MSRRLCERPPTLENILVTLLEIRTKVKNGLSRIEKLKNFHFVTHVTHPAPAEFDRVVASQAVYERDMKWQRGCGIFIAFEKPGRIPSGRRCQSAHNALRASCQLTAFSCQLLAEVYGSSLGPGGGAAQFPPRCEGAGATPKYNGCLALSGFPLPSREQKKTPPAWRQRRATVVHGWALPFHALEWIFEWLAYGLSRWAFLEVLEYLGTFSVLVAVLFYFAEAGDRRKQKHYQAWQVINTAQGKGGSGGRIEALQELNEDHQPLAGLDAPAAILQGVRLPGANLLRCNLEATDLRDSRLAGADLEFANLRSANFRGGDLHQARLRHADLEGADLVGANLAGCDLAGANLRNTDLRNIDISGLIWRDIKSIRDANIYGVRNPPEGFLPWALAQGARSAPDEPE
jgi:hypothetical protein